MKKAVLLVALASVLVAAGCASQSEVLAKQQPTAVTTAVKRAAFDFNCPDAKGEVISSDYIQPAVSGGRWMAVQGVTRLEYTVGVEGCGTERGLRRHVPGGLLELLRVSDPRDVGQVDAP